MSNPNDEKIKEAHSAFLSQIETIDTEGILAIIKNYKLLINQLDAYNGQLINHLIQIAENLIKNRSD